MPDMRVRFEAQQASQVMGSDDVLFLGIFTEECWEVFLDGVDQLFLKLDAIGVVRQIDYYLPCAMNVVSKVLGYAVILGSLGFKVPQISAIWKSRSAQGLSLAAFELDAFVFVSVDARLRSGLPVSEFGEQGVVLVQNVLLVALVWMFGNAPLWRVSAMTAVFIGVAFAIAALPDSVLFILPNIALLTSFSSRVPQIITNQRQRHTGQLATSTTALNVAGALARVLTTLGGSKNALMLFSYTSSFLLSFIVLSQIFLFRHNTHLALQHSHTKKQL